MDDGSWGRRTAPARATATAGRPGRGRRARSWATAAGVALALAAGCAAPVPVGLPPGAGDVVAPAAPDTVGPIRFRGTELVDGHGRVVQLHGINMVRKSAPFRVSPDEPGFDANLERVRRSGFNAVRLGVWMAALMPEPGVVDESYLDEVVRGAEELQARGLWVLYDVHQDVFRGMPEWATSDAAAALSPTLPGAEDGFWALAYFAPRSMRQWEDLYARVPVLDGRSAVDLMGDAVAALAARVADQPNVVGIDLLNEPWPGERFFDCLVGGCGARYGQLRSIYAEHTAKVRAVAPDLPVWWAPFNWGPPFQQTPGPDQPGVGLTYHSYCLYTDGGEPVQPSPVEHTLCRAVYEGQTDEAIALARSWGAPVLLGEFGASASPLNTTRLTQLADERLLSWMYWDDNYFRQAPDVVRSDLVRPYPQATAGTPLRQRYDPATGEFELRVRPDHAVAAPTAVVVPPDAYPDGYDVEVVGGTVVSEPQAGRLEVAADPTAQLLRVRLTRR